VVVSGIILASLGFLVFRPSVLYGQPKVALGVSYTIQHAYRKLRDVDDDWSIVFVCYVLTTKYELYLVGYK
jgi:hypothetical protein